MLNSFMAHAASLSGRFRENVLVVIGVVEPEEDLRGTCVKAGRTEQLPSSLLFRHARQTLSC
jgi:hypothetical protein